MALKMPLINFLFTYTCSVTTSPILRLSCPAGTLGYDMSLSDKIKLSTWLYAFEDEPCWNSMNFLTDCKETVHGLLKNSCLGLHWCFFDVLFVSDMRTEWKHALFITQFSWIQVPVLPPNGDCFKAAPYSRTSPTTHPLTPVCSRVCLTSPCLNTKQKASHTVKTKLLNTQCMPVNCSLVFCGLPLVLCWALSHHSVLCCLPVLLYYYV